MRRSATSPDRTKTAAASVLANMRRVIHAIHAQSTRIESASGLTGPQFWALREINRELAGISLGELARRLVLHKATAGRIVDRLQARGLVQSERPANDRRYVMVRVTQKGKKLADRPVPGPAQADLLSSLETLPTEEVERIDETLARLVELLGAEKVEAGPLFEEKRGQRSRRNQ